MLNTIYLPFEYVTGSEKTYYFTRALKFSYWYNWLEGGLSFCLRYSSTRIGPALPSDSHLLPPLELEHGWLRQTTCVHCIVDMKARAMQEVKI